MQSSSFASSWNEGIELAQRMLTNGRVPYQSVPSCLHSIAYSTNQKRLPATGMTGSTGITMSWVLDNGVMLDKSLHY
jgi:hypothetical protein